MAAIAFDTLKFVRRLMAAGVPGEQAEAQAELMAEAFVFNMDSLVTRDYLDARLAEQDARIDARFAEQDARIEARFAEQDAKTEARFAGQDARNDIHFAEIHGQLKLHTWILGAVAASTVLPFLHSLFSF